MRIFISALVQEILDRVWTVLPLLLLKAKDAYERSNRFTVFELALVQLVFINYITVARTKSHHGIKN